MPWASRVMPSQDVLRQRLTYDPVTGLLTWKHRPREYFAADVRWRQWNTRYAGKAPGRQVGNYWAISLDKQEFYAHRLIWKWVTGDDPPFGVVDHHNRRGLDNAWNNLRLATYLENQGNRMGGKNTSGCKGVFVDRRKKSGFYAMFRGRRLGTFPNIEDAHAAYCAAAEAHFGVFWRPT